MINFNKVKEDFEIEAYDILRYECYYNNNIEEIFLNFKNRMTRYIKDTWGTCCDYKFYIQKSILGYKIQFTEESTGGIPFGFEFCIDINMLINTKLGID